MESVWVVEEGEYSDYRVLAIFSSEGQAKEFCDHRKHAAYREWVLDQWTPENSVFHFTFDLKGNVTEERSHALIEPLEESVVVFGDREQISVRVFGGPRDRALKVATEGYAKVRAFLDEAIERTDQRWAKISGKELRGEYGALSGRELGGDERGHISMRVAKILAGLEPMPTRPSSLYGEWILDVLEPEAK